MSGVLTLVLVLGMLPASVMATLLDNDPARNREILTELEQIVGSEEEALAYYDILQRYNLLDEDGNAVTSWEIRMDGREITLEELREVLAGDYDPDYYITVDGMPIALGDVAAILEIEDYLAYLRETYFDGQQWTAEQQASLDALVDQINRDGIVLTSGTGDTLGGSGVNHAAQVMVGYPLVDQETNTATSTVTLRNAAPGQEVTFHWEALSGTQPVSGTGDVTLVANQWGEATTTLTIQLNPVTTDTVQSSGNLVWYLKLDGITNATFSDGNPVYCWKVTGTPTATSEDMSALSHFQFDESGANVQVALTDAQRKAIEWGAMDTAELAPMVGTLDEQLVYRWPDGDKVTVYSYQLFAKAGDVTLAQVNYAGKRNSDVTDFVIERDEALKNHVFAPLADFQGQITIGGICSKTTYAKNGSTWVSQGETDISDQARSVVILRNQRPPEVLDISAPAGTYYPGQVVPVTITFSEPVNQNAVQVKFNGESEPVRSEILTHYSNVITVAYPVKEVDNENLYVSSITASDGGANYLTGYNPGGDGSSGQLLTGVRLETPLKSTAVTNVSARVAGTPAAPQLQVDVAISDNSDLTRWLGSAVEQVEGRWQTKVDSLFVSLDGGATRYPLVFPGETVTGQTGTAANPAGSVTIPGDVLVYDYSGGGSTYTVTVSAAYAGTVYSDTATISLEARPAQVGLGKLNSYYITDETWTVSIPWSVTNLDRRGNAQELDIFRFQITRNSELVNTASVTLGQGTGDGSYSGTYVLDIADVVYDGTPSSYRQVYTVTLQAKNGADSTWSYDSFLLYVYDADALKLMVDGAEAGGSLTMSNRDAISNMSQEEILALKRDIYLRNVISVNYGQYAWTEVADQIAWASSNGDAASVNYQQGTLYEDIRNFPYVSYRPTEDFLLSGKTDGATTITATHKLTGITDSLDVTVETLKDRLYLFQCYPQAATTLTFRVYTDAGKTATEDVTITSDNQGAAAYYAEYGIASDVYCQSTGSDGNLYVGTFYRSELRTGEQDAASMALYPCNNLQMRRAAYAYVYLKKPDGTPYTGDITFRGGVYVNGTYRETALFQLNGHGNVDQRGDADQTVTLGADGKLTVVMDQSQWGLAGGVLTVQDRVEYVFQIQKTGSTEYYPLMLTISANANADDYVGSGEAVVSFRANDTGNKHPFILQQTTTLANYGAPASLLGYTGKVGPSDSCPETVISTAVLWWGDERSDDPQNSLQLKTAAGDKVASQEGQFTLSNTAYPFSDSLVTYYTVNLNAESLYSLPLAVQSTGLRLEYYRDGETLTRREELPFQLCNMLGQGRIEEQPEVKEALEDLSKATEVNADNDPDISDQFTQIALNLVADENYITDESKFFTIQIAPTSDPTRFLGFIEVNLGNMENNVTGVYADSQNRNVDFSYGPGLSETMLLTGFKTPMEYGMGQMDDLFKVLKRKPVRNISFQLSGYAESLIFYNDNTKRWEVMLLDGGFHAGGGLSYTWNWNTMVGPVPVTSSLSIGGTAEVGMDALAVVYRETTSDGTIAKWGNDFLTELRIYLYLRAFAGVGFDYSIVALKLGIYGQINLDMQYQWLNRPYMDSSNKIVNAADGSSNRDGSGNSISYNLDGQRFRIDGQIGLEFLVKFLFISYEKVLYSYNFNLLDETTGDWNTIQTNWSKNQAAIQDYITDLLNDKNATLTTIGGQQMLSLELAPTMESRDYLTDGAAYRRWGDGGISTFALDAEQSLQNLETNTYPYANPMVSDDGSLVAYLSDMDSTDPADTRVKFAVGSGGSYGNPAVIDDNGYGDSQLSLAGTGSFAVAAWTRQTETVNKDEGAVITTDDQMVMMNSTEAYAAVYTGSGWTTTRLSSNASPDLAPVAAANGSKAIVFWRAVSSSGTGGAVTTFDQKDTIVYRIYDGTAWSEAQTLYNGTSGSVKGITAAMLEDGTAAVAYTLGTGADITGQEIVYAVVDIGSGDVVRNVQATNDGYLDENPQLAAVKFADEQERFVLGWYTEQAVSTDSARVLDSGSETGSGSETVSDIRLLDFDQKGVSGRFLPDSISQAADAYGVSITSDFRFTRNADTIEDLSILCVERAQGSTAVLPEEGSGSQSDDADLSALQAEKDVLKGVKFYTSGGAVRFTGAIDIAEMPEATLIDHFDAYVSDSAANEVKAVLLGTTYGANGAATTRTVTLADGETQAQVTVPAQTAAMYTATETYQDKIEVPGVLADHETIYPGSVTQIQFTVENRGIHVIDGLEIQVGGTTTNLTTTILPGQTVPVTADYLVPESGVVDPQYIVTASFTSDGAAGTAKSGGRQVTGTAYLDLPNLQITEARIVGEEDGLRTIQVKLNNTLAASLGKTGRSVSVGFYADATCQVPMDGLDPIRITSLSDLAMIDEGGYGTLVTFDVGEYLRKDGGAAQEIPDSGVTVYIKAEILEEENGTQKTLGEPVISDNTASVTCESLKQRTGQEAILTSTLSNEGGKSTVTVDLQNTSLTQTTTGNLVVTLLDENGKVLAQRQCYDGSDSSLITLQGEEKARRTFTFDQAGADVEVLYSDLLLDVSSAELTDLSFSNFPHVTLDLFERQDNQVTQVQTDLASVNVRAVAKSAKARITMTVEIQDLSGTGDKTPVDTIAAGNALNETVDLAIGKSNILTIRIRDGELEKTYVFTIWNYSSNVTFTWGDGTNAAENPFSVNAVYGSGPVTIPLTTDYISTAYVWYACDQNGDHAEPIFEEPQETGTLTLSEPMDAGTYYYKYKMLYVLLDESSTVKDCWSQVATVTISKAGGNGVAVTGTTATYDGNPHGLESVTATQPDSTLHYSTDYTEGGQGTWSETPPTFTEAGTHTVWVYASHKNYADTEPVSATVTITETSEIQFKLETSGVADAFATYPEEIRNRYQDAAGLETELKTRLIQLGISGDNTAIYDVKLYYKVDGREQWVEATAENFPAEKLTVKLPYPAGTNRYNYNFTLLHMITNPLRTGKTVGDVEPMDITLEEDGICFTTDCLSPFALGWTRRPSGTGGYAVTVEKTEHGSVTVSPQQARYGETVTIETAPDGAYQVENVVVTASDGKAVAVTEKSPNVYTFTMPAGAVSVAVTFGKTGEWENPFSDVADDVWYRDSVQYVHENGLMTGTGADTFSPDRTTTRGMIVTILYRLEGAPELEKELWGEPFADVDADAWYAGAVYWARANGIVTGYSDELFGPDDTITREQMATILYRYARYKEYDTTGRADLSRYTDADRVSPYAGDAMAWANAEELVSGTTSTTLSPQGGAIRSQVAAILMRFCKKFFK